VRRRSWIDPSQRAIVGSWVSVAGPASRFANVAMAQEISIISRLDDWGLKSGCHLKTDGVYFVLHEQWLWRLFAISILTIFRQRPTIPFAVDHVNPTHMGMSKKMLGSSRISDKNGPHWINGTQDFQTLYISCSHTGSCSSSKPSENDP
jgi:hypothetical protein